MAVYKAKGTVSWFDFGKSKIRFNADEKVEKRNVFFKTRKPKKKWKIVSFDVTKEFYVLPEIKDALWGVAQNSSHVVVYIEHICLKSSSGARSKWTITNIALENENEN